MSSSFRLRWLSFSQTSFLLPRICLLLRFRGAMFCFWVTNQKTFQFNTFKPIKYRNARVVIGGQKGSVATRSPKCVYRSPIWLVHTAQSYHSTERNYVPVARTLGQAVEGAQDTTPHMHRDWFAYPAPCPQPRWISRCVQMFSRVEWGSVWGGAV